MNNPFQLTDSQVKYKNPWIQVREDKVIRPGGKEGIFGVVEMVQGASILPVDDDGNVLLVKEYKYAVERESIEVISGAVDEGETPLEAAKRELLEETGVQASSWKELGTVDPFTTVVKSPNHMFLAQGLRHLQPSPDEGEILTKIVVPYDKALEMVLGGVITHAASCVVILKAKEFIHFR